jgi:hypothetical protein
MQECFPVLRVANIFKYYINRNIAHSMSKFCNIHTSGNKMYKSTDFFPQYEYIQTLRGRVLTWVIRQCSDIRLIILRKCLIVSHSRKARFTSLNAPCQSVSVNVYFYNSRILRHSEIIHCCEQFYITYWSSCSGLLYLHITLHSAFLQFYCVLSSIEQKEAKNCRLVWYK